MNEFRPHNTAIRRTSPSPMAKFVTDCYYGMSLLDYGCGRFDDKPYYEDSMSNVVGYDPYEPFGYSEKPDEVFDVVVLNFVLNVIPTLGERASVVRDACDYALRRVVVATRSVYSIYKEAEKNGWRRYNGGYVSSESRRTFQYGMDQQELIDLFDEVSGWQPLDLPFTPGHLHMTFLVFAPPDD